MLRLDLYKYFSLFKLVIKPDSLLLEARRSQTSSEGHNQASGLPLFFELAIVHQHDKKIKRLPAMFEDKDFRRKAFLRLKVLRAHFFGIACFFSSKVAVGEIFHHCRK